MGRCRRPGPGRARSTTTDIGLIHGLRTDIFPYGVDTAIVEPTIALGLVNRSGPAV
jgi:hypothetical protein